MQKNQVKKPDYIFEVSWEICNKVGGIYTVISTKARTLSETFHDNVIMIGPDVWREATNYTEFTEEDSLFRSWKEVAKKQGLKIRVGRWNIPGKPITILVDYTPLFAKKDEILANLWIKYHLDSLSGKWDYIEPALFGYAAGMIIENFHLYHLSQNDRTIAHFHEWLTGAGILYLKERMPEIGTVFTTHATVAGRAIAGQGLPFYSQFETLEVDKIIKANDLIAKFSLEKTAAERADCFTTVSKLTARECKQFLGKEVDLITANGFEEQIVPDVDTFEDKRTKARDKLTKVASATLGYQVQDDCLLVATSGRYEFANKGLDVFVDTMRKLADNEKLDREIIAFMLVPAAHTQPREEILFSLSEKEFHRTAQPEPFTHHLQDKDHDQIYQRIVEKNLKNDTQSPVKIIYVPTYLDGNDGLFNMKYYELLIGFDLTVFPSYYEPFGYTPLESLAFHIPTITTSLTGFGITVTSKLKKTSDGIFVVERTDENYDEVVDKIANHLLEFSFLTEKEREAQRESAHTISRIALWSNLIAYYKDAYNLALQKVEKREAVFRNQRVIQTPIEAFIEPPAPNKPIWRNIFIEFKIPEKLNALDALSRNLWWTWNDAACELFESLDHEGWESSGCNPIALQNGLFYDRWQELENDPAFLKNLELVHQEFEAYMNPSHKKQGPGIAYFSMEYGLHTSLKLYSGGLGILAGDYLKEASDANLKMTGIGLLYRYGYFDQLVNLKGEQIESYKKEHFTKLPIHPVYDQDNERLTIGISFPGRTVWAQAWRIDVGRIPLYLLDTDIDSNSKEDRTITYHLYGGDEEMRIKQEILIGVGGILLIEKLGISATLYHCNEGHAAFSMLERVRNYVQKKNLTFLEAAEVVKSSTVFTTHTPVPAGHDFFSEELVRTYLSGYHGLFNVSWERFLKVGKTISSANEEKFCMSFFAARLAQKINGVSKLHRLASNKIFNPLWEGLTEEELNIDYVTNGIHYGTWVSKKWKQLFNKLVKNHYIDGKYQKTNWDKIREIPDKSISEIKGHDKHRLIRALQKRFSGADHDPYKAKMSEILNGFSTEEFIMVFARRFASYKRAYLLFDNPARLSKIVNNPERPARIIICGKAHPRDDSGKQIIRKIIQVSMQPEFLGKIVFIQNYDMDLARFLVQGADLWINTPKRLHEASGTSGMKAAMNGVINLSVPDGWWAEAYNENAGWALPETKTYENENDQNSADAETIYNLLENEIIPEFFDRDKNSIASNWVERMKNCIMTVAPYFSTARMLNEYQSKFYYPLNERHQQLTGQNFAEAKKLVTWKKRLRKGWNNIYVIEMKIYDTNTPPMELGEKLGAEVTLDIGSLSEHDIGVELVIAKIINEQVHIKSIHELEILNKRNKQVTYKTLVTASFSGTYKYGFRISPKNELLLYKRDMPLVKWI